MAKSTAPVGSIQNGSFIMGADEFRSSQGKLYAGLAILKIDVGQAAGPFVLVDILKDQNLNKKKTLKKGEKPNLVDVYVAEFNGSEIRMPASASFVMKAKEAKLSKGDKFAVLRNPNYKNSHGNDNSMSWELKVYPKK